MSANISTVTGFRRSVQSGDVVVPLKEILEKLESQVSPQVLENLLREIISKRRNEVRPGELITADLMNQILYQLASLEARVTALEGAKPTTTTPPVTPVRITEIRPQPRRVGQEVEVVGENFVVPVDPPNNRLTVAGTAVGRFKVRSNDRLLVFDIPEVSATLSPTGTGVQVVVENRNGTDSEQMILQPALTFPVGTLGLRHTSSPVLPVNPASPTIEPVLEPLQQYIFGFELTATVDRQAVYNLTAASTVTGWNPQVLAEDSDQVITEITIPGNLSGERRRLRVRVTTPPRTAGASPSTTLSLNVTPRETGAQVLPVTSQLTLAVGSPPPKPITTVGVTFNSPNFGAEMINGQLLFTRNVMGGLSFTAFVRNIGQHTITTRLSRPTGWTLVEPTSPTPANVTSTGGTVSPLINVTLTPGASAAATDIVFTIERTGGGEPFSVSFLQPISIR